MKKRTEENPPKETKEIKIVDEFFMDGRPDMTTSGTTLSYVQWFTDRRFRPGNIGVVSGFLYGKLVVLGKEVPISVVWEREEGKETRWYIESRTGFTSELLSELNESRWYNQEGETPVELAKRVGRVFRSFFENEGKIERMVEEMDGKIKEIVKASMEGIGGELSS